MPIKVNNAVTSGQVDYGNPFVNAPTGYHQMAVPITALTAFEVDVKGFIKPGVPLRSNGALVSAPAQAIFGVTPEAIKVAASNSVGDIAAAGTVQLTVATIGQVNRKIIEDNLGRVLTADEIAGFSLAGSLIKLLA